MLAVAALGLLGFVGISAYFAWHFTGPQRKAVGLAPAPISGLTTSVSFLATDGVHLSGWWLDSPGASTAIVLLHGHSSNRLQMVARARLLHDHGFAVLLYDSRGHGLSEDSRTSVGWYETRDLLGAIAFLKEKGFAEIGCIGASQGGATIALTGSRLPAEVKLAVLESTYPTMRDALDRRFRVQFNTPGWLAGLFFVPIAEYRLHLSIDQMAPIDHVGELRCPVMVMGGEVDADTFAQNTRAIYAAVTSPKDLWIVPGAGHVDLYGYAKAEYERRLLAFISSARLLSPTARDNPKAGS